ncbi:MAG TPA: hypothetical protein PKE66_04135 [Pyrinomonadaceae bacterium]|nr:hypothetical protein [Pyrinomonadaceae bacterium]
MSCFFKFVRNISLLLIMSTCLIACADVRSQSKSVEGNTARVEPSPPAGHAPHEKLNQLETLVRQYCTHAFNGDINEVKQLVEVLPISPPPRSNKDKKQDTASLNFGIFSEIDRNHLEREIPEMIFIGKFYITRITVSFHDRNTGKVEATLRSQVAPERSRTLVFSLHRIDDAWKIDGATFKEFEDLDKAPMIVDQSL